MKIAVALVLVATAGVLGLAVSISLHILPSAPVVVPVAPSGGMSFGDTHPVARDGYKSY